jgi:hypothetical protein
MNSIHQAHNEPQILPNFDSKKLSSDTYEGTVLMFQQQTFVVFTTAHYMSSSISPRWRYVHFPVLSKFVIEGSNEPFSCLAHRAWCRKDVLPQLLERDIYVNVTIVHVS